MRALVICAAALVLLAVVGDATAKGPASLQICGTDGCVALGDAPELLSGATGRPSRRSGPRRTTS